MLFERKDIWLHILLVHFWDLEMYRNPMSFGIVFKNSLLEFKYFGLGLIVNI